jgi:competence protein ComEC
MLVASSAVVAGALLGWPGAIGFTIVTAVALALCRQQIGAMLILTIVAGAVGVTRVALHEPPAVAGAVLSSTQAEVIVSGQPQIGPSGPRAVVDVERIRRDGGAWVDAPGVVLVFFGDTVDSAIARGDRLQVSWVVTPADSLDPDFRRFVASSGAGAQAWAFHTSVVARTESPLGLLARVRDGVTDRVRAAIGGDAGALLAGFVTGDDSGLSRETRRAFELTNTSHITAVSGSNVAVLLSIWYLILPTRRSRRLLPAMIGTLVVIWLYVALVGFGPGAVRAGLFASLIVPAARLGRRADPMTALMGASAAMVLASPGYAGNVGFWLSLAASGAIVSTIPIARTTPGAALKRGLVALVAAQVATLPVTFWVFDGWSPSSLIANLVIGPMVAAFFPIAFVTAILVSLAPWLGDVVGWLPALGADLIIAIARSLAGELPMLRAGAMPASGIALVALFSVAALAVVSADIHRWLARVQAASSGATHLLVPLALGAGAGVWIGGVLFVILG